MCPRATTNDEAREYDATSANLGLGLIDRCDLPSVLLMEDDALAQHKTPSDALSDALGALMRPHEEHDSIAGSQQQPQRAPGPQGAGRFRGVTRHKRSLRFESHAWVSGEAGGGSKGSQAYIGAWTTEEAAARAYDIVTLFTRGEGRARTNFHVSDYTEILPLLDAVSLHQLIAMLRRRSKSFARERTLAVSRRAVGSSQAQALNPAQLTHHRERPSWPGVSLQSSGRWWEAQLITSEKQSVLMEEADPGPGPGAHRLQRFPPSPPPPPPLPPLAPERQLLAPRPLRLMPCVLLALPLPHSLHGTAFAPALAPGAAAMGVSVPSAFAPVLRGRVLSSALDHQSFS